MKIITENTLSFHLKSNPTSLPLNSNESLDADRIFMITKKTYNEDHTSTNFKAIYRHLNKITSLFDNNLSDTETTDNDKKQINDYLTYLNLAIKNKNFFKITYDRLLSLTNYLLYKEISISKNILEAYLIGLYLFAPILAKTLWTNLGNTEEISENIIPSKI